MNRTQYDALLERVQAGYFVTHEGRTARNKDELDWIATQVYGLDLATPTGRLSEPLTAETLESTGEEQAPPLNGGENPERTARMVALMALSMDELVPIVQQHNLAINPKRPGTSKAVVVAAILGAEFPPDQE